MTVTIDLRLESFDFSSGPLSLWRSSLPSVDLALFNLIVFWMYLFGCFESNLEDFGPFDSILVQERECIHS